MPGPDRHRVFVGARPMGLMRHAVERYIERVKPALLYAQALEELERMLRLSDVTLERPVWAPGSQCEVAWVVLTDGIAFPVADDGCLVTCLTRGEVGTELRVIRGEERRARAGRNGQRGSRKKHGKVARDARRRARAAREAME